MGKNTKGENLNMFVTSNLLAIGWEISIPLVIFVLLGVFLDKKLNTGHTLLISGIFLSLFTSSYAIYKNIKNISKGGK
jgi:F0F1-type ATP synthase assembly protein I